MHQQHQLLSSPCQALPVDAMVVKVVLPEGLCARERILCCPRALPSDAYGYTGILRILLTGATVLDVNTAAAWPAWAASVTKAVGRRWGVLDGPFLGGRPVVSVRVQRVVSFGVSAASLGSASSSIIIRYTAPQSFLLKYATLSCTLFSVFLLVSLLSRCHHDITAATPRQSGATGVTGMQRLKAD
jgi:hypothetical protein